jgi:hypothetical protein
MEIIVALVVIALIGYWVYTANNKPSVTEEAAPYKVETKVEEVNAQPVVIPVTDSAVAVTAPKAKKAPAKKPAAAPKAKAPAKKPAAKKPAAKPAVKKAPAKKKPSA